MKPSAVGAFALAAMIGMAAIACVDAREPTMTRHATGTFTVELVPLSVNESVADDARGRMSINKRFEGDLDARSVGEMLTAGTPTRGSAAYVAIERVSGRLHGRSGAFSLHHTGVMERGTPNLSVRIVPDSGSGELAGIAGTLDIVIIDGKHAYDLAYTLPE